MTIGKWLFDIVLVLLLAGLLALPFGCLLLVLRLREGPGLFHVSERMRGVDRPFLLWKLRTMRPASGGGDSGVTGADKTDRITPMGHRLRRLRLDEIPQLWNVLRGDMSLVGPRPPLRQYVERFPDLYAQVLLSRPGVTGLASLHFHRHEEWLLARCRTAAETDRVYADLCVPRKAALDLIYQRHASLCLDMMLLWRTAVRVLPGRGRSGG